MQRTGFVYVLLRLGDAGLLAAILILAETSGSLMISTSLAAGPELSGADLAWTVAGLSLAVWIKCGIWPLHGWLTAADGLDQITSAWLYGVAMQSLGLYLLYRVTPLITLQPVARWAIFATGLLSIAGLFLRYRRHHISHESLWINAGSSLIGSIALCSAALGYKGLVVILLLAATPARMVMTLFTPSRRMVTPQRRAAVTPSTGMSPFARSESSLLGLARTVRQRFETGILDLSVTRSWATLMKVAEMSHSTVEEQGFGTLLSATAEVLLKISRWLQRRHTGQLRAHLRWIIAGFVLVVVVIVLQGW
jgi:NADH:ubiquinone oxidoreductase subunit 5 (subunit L)/multisubunit Na+/H+ antiporter MnhA subunit